MTLQAAGAYLQRLREEANITRHAMAKRVGTSDSQIIRIEQGQETRYSLLSMIIKVVDASSDDVVELALSSDNTTEEGIRRAELWIEKRGKEKEGKAVVHPDVIRLISQMTDYDLGRWVSAGQRLLEERMKR